MTEKRKMMLVIVSFRNFYEVMVLCAMDDSKTERSLAVVFVK